MAAQLEQRARTGKEASTVYSANVWVALPTRPLHTRTCVRTLGHSLSLSLSVSLSLSYVPWINRYTLFFLTDRILEYRSKRRDLFCKAAKLLIFILERHLHNCVFVGVVGFILVVVIKWCASTYFKRSLLTKLHIFCNVVKHSYKLFSFFSSKRLPEEERQSPVADTEK